MLLDSDGSDTLGCRGVERKGSDTEGCRGVHTSARFDGFLLGVVKAGSEWCRDIESDTQ